MLYLAIAISVSLSNLAAPIHCLTQLFYVKCRTKETDDERSDRCKVPDNVSDMRKLIKTLKADK